MDLNVVLAHIQLAPRRHVEVHLFPMARRSLGVTNTCNLCDRLSGQFQPRLVIPIDSFRRQLESILQCYLCKPLFFPQTFSTY